MALRWYFNSYLGRKSLIGFWSALGLKERTNEEGNDLPVFSYVYNKDISTTASINN